VISATKLGTIQLFQVIKYECNKNRSNEMVNKDSLNNKLKTQHDFQNLSKNILV